MTGAAQRWLVVGCIAMWMGSAAGSAAAADVTNADRSYGNYIPEAATVGDKNVRVEVRGMAVGDEGGNRLNIIYLRLAGLYPNQKVTQLSGGEIDVLGSFGLGKSGEVGFIVPSYFESLQFQNAPTLNVQDVGDLGLYLKFKHSVAEHCSIGAGVQVTIPNGPKNKGLSRGELGETPMVSARWEHGPYALGVNAGYEIYSGTPADIFDYGAQAIVRGSENWAFRTEIVGRVFNDGGHSFDALQLLPGIDVNLAPNFTVRPQGMAGLTNSALDWGVGAGVMYTFPVGQAAPPPPPEPQAAAEPPPVPVKEKIVLRGVHFDFNKATIRADAKPILDQAAATLKEHASVAVTVEGHTDSIGSDTYNQKLSVRRAAAVREYLAGQGVDASRMTVVGKGESDPVASNDTADGRAQNRRVELLVKD
jgi:outer membrane protein OmpA-like peptidoglycan-associated protein